MNGDREQRLRARIDTLTDRLETAATQQNAALEQLADSRRQRKKLRNRIYDLERSVQLWRRRAIDRAKR